MGFLRAGSPRAAHAVAAQGAPICGERRRFCRKRVFFRTAECRTGEERRGVLPGHVPGLAKAIRPPLPGSYEELFSTLEKKRFFIDLRAENDAIAALRVERLQRAIGVIYRPETERMSHYFRASLPLQFDLMIHLEETHALRPLPAQAHRRPGEMDETYPSGL